MYPMVGPISMSKLRCFLDFTSWDPGIGWLGQVSPQQCTMISKSARKKPNANDVCMFSSVFNPLYLYTGWSHWIDISKAPILSVHFQVLVVIYIYSHSYRGCFHGYTHCSPQLDPQQYQTFTSCQVKPRTCSWVIELASNWFWKSNLSWKNGYMIFDIWYTIYIIHIVHCLNQVTQTYTN